MRYFPLIPRLKRLYMSSNTARDMIWHFDRKDEKIISHPSDGEAWKRFDKRYEDFAIDPRSVRLGLASDVIFIILSLIIPGKYGPGIDIDVYLQPLIHELKLLWEGVDAFDVYSGKKFKLRAALHSTINDFPAYAMLSGWSTKGYKACPSCANFTESYKFGGKIVYPGSRKWLPIDHPFLFQANLFDGKKEYGLAPVPASGTEILKQLEEVNYVYGKSKTISKKEGDKKLGHLIMKVRMMKSRDDKKAREALKERNIKSHLWLQSHPNRVKEYMPPAAYNMCKEDKERFLKVLKKLRVPDGYGSNLQRCVNMKERRLINMKSHDNHILMQDLLPVALRASNATKVTDLLEELSYFFKKICSTAIDKGELDTIQSNLVLTLCKMEKEFLPTFFTIMVHLLIHLVDEVKLGGPVHYRWMYPIESDFLQLKRQEHGVAANEYLENQWRLKEFSDWLQNQVHNLDDSTQEGKLRKALAGGLSNRGKRIKSFIINGYKFDTVDRERFRKTQNSGVMVEADGQVYYGKLKDIFELDYFGSFKVVMFRCDGLIYVGVVKHIQVAEVRVSTPFVLIALEVIPSVVLKRVGFNHVVGHVDFAYPKGSSPIASLLRGASILLRLKSNWDWFINLSAKDYPLVTKDDVSIIRLIRNVMQVLYKHKIILFGGFYDTLREVRLQQRIFYVTFSLDLVWVVPVKV
ncbi:uncharacterized protein LOC130589521 [Beta vulgaris subsp. vulgaris]|uniref:uncharacterized protein LOC130589521 n=1 Tax=Beta vulgaris subsp. vulgaris TaxID=3555 RepID=UPI002549033C|nr:uncharacterized protein LOC130589521 [Beta vulgaris subsp. vulgaris]